MSFSSLSENRRSWSADVPLKNPDDKVQHRIIECQLEGMYLRQPWWKMAVRVESKGARWCNWQEEAIRENSRHVTATAPNWHPHGPIKSPTP